MSPSSKERRKLKSTSNPKRKRYDVYLSFCDQTFQPFVLGIYKALTSKRLVVFWDDQRFENEDRKSKQPSDSTLNVIEDCKMVVIVFSKSYTKSIWSLRELEKITQCCQRTTDPLIVLPVFCSGRCLHDFPDFVDRIPTEEETSSKDESLSKFMYLRARIINKTSSEDEDNIKYDGEAFHHFLDRISMAKENSSEDDDKFMTWVAAITNEASKYDHITPTLLWHEKEDIQNVVECVTRVLNKKRYSFEESTYSAAQDLIQLMKQSKSPLFLGIWGMPGVGKTAIAERIFKHIGPFFKHMCFLKNVRGVWELNNVHVSLQRELLSVIEKTIEVKVPTIESFPSQHDQFLSDFDKTIEVKIPTIKSGSVILKEKLQHKRVLLILDDVNKLEQLQALCGNQDWFGPGSKVIITTSNRHLLKEHGIDHIVRVKELDESQSLELFNLHTSKKSTSPNVFVQLSKQIVGYYCGGLPLALKVLGRDLRGKNLLQWKSVLRSLESFSIPAPPLLEALEKSFSNLSDAEKQIFLDIACFFIGVNRDDVLQTLNRSTQCAALQINRLEDKSFVTIDENNNLEMHVLLHAMARDIIKRESSNKSNQSKRYDVFLSFRGEDCRKKFISHLYTSFQIAGINVFKDDNEIQRGDEISISLLQAIKRSRISVVVLSTTYANSRWCMLELEEILEIGRTRDLVVVPVFYEVDPSEVRNQNGQFGKSFEDLISTISMNESKKSKWRRDLVDIAGIAGFVPIDSRNESLAIKEIVERVTRLLDRTELFVAEHPVGVESRVEAATKLLNINSDDVLLLGIWGMGGTGKTTIAKSIYNQIGSKFEGRSFLLNIREFWKAGPNQVSLQQQVLCDVYKTTAFKIRDIESGKNILKEKLAQNRVLFVLDDVNEQDQLKVLCGSREWFGPGSRIIITTRDLHLLKLCRVNKVYEIQEMDKSESLELFSWHAFKKPIPTEDLAALSAEVIAYSGKLPLALEVLGSYLCGCTITEWRKVLEKLKWIPNDQVQKKLQVSYDGLKYVTEKDIFLDIACFFIGMDQKDVIQILNGCGFFADDGIKVLIERALVTVDNRNKLRMHDLLRDMGRQIVNEKWPSDPGKRSRLWRKEEVYDILANRKGTEAIKGLALDFPIKDCLETDAFMKMNKLRLLRLAGGVKLKGDFKFISGELRWLSWNSFPETYVPAEFQQRSLVAVKLKHSKLKQLWKKSQMLENLIILNLSHSLDLTETPDFSYLPNLEKLVLKNCPSLSTVSHSIGSLHKILLINLRDCTGLRELPRSIYKLKSLETLILSGCSMIDKLEEDLEQMESLITLIADKTAIKNVPFSIVRLKNIGYISLSDFEGFSHDVFPSLIQHWMSPSNNVISFVGTSMSMSSVGSLKDYQKLRILCVDYGSDLQLTQDKSIFLDVLKATSYQKLEASASSNASEMSEVQIFTSRSTNHLKSLLIKMGTKCQVSNIAVDSVLQTTDASRDSFLLSLDKNSDWLTFRCKGCSKIFDIPTIGRNLKSMILFVVYYSSSENITSEGFQGVLITNYTKTTVHAYKRDTLTSFEDEDWQSITSNLEPGNKVEVMVVFGEGFIVEETRISLLYDEPVNEEMECCCVVDVDDVIVSGNNDNNVGVSCGDNEVINQFGEETVDHLQITSPKDGWYADVMGPVQLVPHDLDPLAKAVAEEIRAAEAHPDQEHQVPSPEGVPEKQATVTPEAIEPTLGAQILDAIRELRADFVRQELTVADRLNAVEVRLEKLEDGIAQILRRSSFESTDVES